MNMLYDNLHPITSRFAFIETNLNFVVKAFLKWQPLVAAYNNSFVQSAPKTDIIKTFQSLCPLTVGELRRFLFIPTNSNWIMFLDNGHSGTDRTIPEVLSELLSTNMIYVNMSSSSNLFELYNSGKLARFVGVSKENKWKFYQSGDPLGFENKESYTNKIIKARLTTEIIIEYLDYFGNVINLSRCLVACWYY